jgi:flagellar assembly protein FliH
MSSKIVRGKGIETQPIGWQQVGVPPPNPALGVQPFQPQATGSEQAAPAAQARIAELEGKMRALEVQATQQAQAAYQKGRQEADAAVRSQLSAQVDSLVTRLARSVEEMSGLRTRFRHESEEQVVQLALAVARRVMHRELSMDSGALLGLVKAVLEKIDARELHRVRIHPETAAALRQNLDRIGLPARVEVTADPALDRGAALFETTRGTLDASVDTQLAEIERGFADLVRRTA